MGVKGWFCGPGYAASSSNVSAERTRNFVPERNPQTAKGRTALLSRPGLDAPEIIGNGPHRAAFEENGRRFFLSGDGYYERESDGTITLRGTVAFSVDPGTIHGNGPGGQNFITSGGLGYIHNLTTDVFEQISDADFPTDVVMGFYINGHFGVIKRGTRIFAISAAYDGLDWSAIDIAEKSKTTDALVAAVVDKDASELHLIGERMTEVWWYSGTASFPLEPIPNTVIPSGGAATWSWLTVGSSVYGLAQGVEGNVVPVRFTGYAPEPIANHAIAAEIQGYTVDEIRAARAFALEFNGHRLYCLSFSERTTHVFDEATGQWTEWTFFSESTGTESAFLGVTHLFVDGVHYVGSRLDGALYPLSLASRSDNGVVIRRMRRAAYLSDGPQRLAHVRLWFDAQMGVGLTTGQGSAPVGMVRWSDDGGHTWTDERRVTFGKLGEYRARAELWRLGLAGPAGRVYELVVTDPVVVAIADADVDIVSEAA